MAAVAGVVVAGASGCSSQEPIEQPPLAGDVLSTAPAPTAPASADPAPSGSSDAPTPGAGSGSGVTTVAPGVTFSPGAGPSGPTLAPVDPKDEASAVAFVKGYLGALNAAFRGQEGVSIAPYALPGCGSCTRFETSLKQQRGAGLHSSTDVVRLTRVRSDFAPGRSVVLAQVDQPAGRVVDAAGKVVSTSPAKTGVKSAYFLRKIGADWKIEEIKLYRGEV